MIRPVVFMLLFSVAASAPAHAQNDAGQAPPRQLLEVLRGVSNLKEYTAFDWIGGQYDRGTLTLQGFASRPALKQRAEEVAKRTAGVDEVVNEIEVLPTVQSDDDVRLRAYVAIYGHPALERYLPGGGVSGMALREMQSASQFGLDSSTQFRGPHPIHIVVSGGSVQLFGTVTSSGDRQIAEAQVRTMDGVLNVVNHIQTSR